MAHAEAEGEGEGERRGREATDICWGREEGGQMRDQLLIPEWGRRRRWWGRGRGRRYIDPGLVQRVGGEEQGRGREGGRDGVQSHSVVMLMAQ